MLMQLQIAYLIEDNKYAVSVPRTWKHFEQQLLFVHRNSDIDSVWTTTTVRVNLESNQTMFLLQDRRFSRLGYVL